ncbi:MAG: hypothetical protein NVS1B10_07680 [Candidatus Saccharimonadales bacterium]
MSGIYEQQMMREQGLSLVDEHLGYRNKLDPGTDPDGKGAKAPSLILRYSFLVKAPEGVEEEFTEVPEKVMSVPSWRATEMILNREARSITEEEASPYLERQKIQQDKEAKEAKEFATQFIEMEREKRGDIADPIDPERITQLEETLEKQNKKIDQLISLLGGKQ